LVAMIAAGVRLDVHGFGMVVAMIAVWGVATGVCLVRNRGQPSI
jgi:hypothetical protein